MKKKLLAILLMLVAVLSSRADLLWQEPFNYPDGSIISNAPGIWIDHSGTVGDAVINHHRLEISTSPNRSEDVHRDLPEAYTNSPAVLYAGFVINFTNLPSAAGQYFAHYYVSSTNFFGRLFALTGTNLCLPGTFRLGVAGASGTAPSVIYPVDLATNTDYEVVLSFDPVTLYAATLWVNPVSASDPSFTSFDAVPTPSAMTAFAFRQATGFGGFLTVSNVALATTFEEAASNSFSIASAAPVIVYPPQGGTNFVGDPISLSVVANGQNLSGLTYQWRKGVQDVPNPNGNSNVFSIVSAQLGDGGDYKVVVRNPNSGLSVTSTVATIVITNPSTPPVFAQQPTNTTVYFGQTANLTVAASGAGPIGYQWYYNNSPVSGTNFSGGNSNVLTIFNVQTNNGTTGTYRCDATNSFGIRPSSNAVLSAIAPPAVSIGYVRSLVDPVFFLPTNTSGLYQITGIVTTWTNITTAGNASFFVQDATGGIDVFVGGAANMRPQAGDSVTVVGPLGQFNSLLEMNLSASNPAHSVVTNSSGNLLPPGIVLPFNFTNSAAYGGAGNAIRLYQGSVLTFTNVYFVNGGGTNTFAAGQNYTMTNRNGDALLLRVDARVGDFIGKPIPAFAWTVSGPMGFFLSNTATNRSSGYQLQPTRYSEIVTTTPPAVTGTIVASNANPTIRWTAQPFMSYSILSASNVNGPYVPLVSGLTFNTTAGQYTDTNAVSAMRFYRIISP